MTSREPERVEGEFGVTLAERASRVRPTARINSTAASPCCLVTSIALRASAKLV